MSNIDRFFIITGGPGSGKSTLIEALAAEGFPHMPEAGRAIIQEQVAADGDALPWKDRLAFAELMLRREMHSWRAAQELDGVVFFDRGIPDVVGYLKVIGVKPPSHVEAAAQTFRYHPRVFIAPPWPAIFTQDAERKQSLTVAEATYHAMVDVYSKFGYQLVRLPLVPVLERVQFVVDVVRQAGARLT